MSKKIIQLEENMSHLQERIHLCETYIEMNENIQRHYEKRLEHLEDANNVHLEDVIETVVPQSKPVLSVVQKVFRFFVPS